MEAWSTSAPAPVGVGSVDTFRAGRRASGLGRIRRPTFGAFRLRDSADLRAVARTVRYLLYFLFSQNAYFLKSLYSIIF